MEKTLEEKVLEARNASRTLAVMNSRQKDEILMAMAEALKRRRNYIFEQNAADVQQARESGMTGALLKRLTVTEKVLEGMAEGLRVLTTLEDPVGEIEGMWRRPNGLEIGRVRVPLGVIGIIYEARPNVTADAIGLCIKSGNTVVLRGGSEAYRSNRAIVEVMTGAAEEAGLPPGSVQLAGTGHEEAQKLMRMKGKLDLLIPRGSNRLIQTVVENAQVPVIETGVGNCHVYVDSEADLEKAAEVVFNAKTQNPSVCNAAETLLVDREIAADFLPAMLKRLAEAGVEIRGCPQTRAVYPDALEATEEDWAKEYLDLILAVKVVSGIDEAIEHINRYGTSHSEAIVTENYTKARRFLKEVDAAAVYVNASTRFTDGFEYGFGAEIGISTQKLHARGPMGLKELTTTKFIVYGDGQVRG